MTRHSTDSHPQQYDFVSGLSNLVSGKGQCPMCQRKNLDVQKHTCAVMHQFADMSGHVMSPEHFPIMPLRKRPWQSTVSPGLENTSTKPPPEPAEKRARTADGVDDPHEATGHTNAIRQHIALHKCSTCHAGFLSLNGLQIHQQTAHVPPAVDPPLAKRGRPTGDDTIPHRLRATTTEIPVPIQEHECPLYFEHLGRKVVASHLRNVHQIDKPSSFPFRPSLDMFPGRLSCMHCKANFTMAFALKNHFDRGTCPVLLLNWVRDAHYGPKIEIDPSPSTQQALPPLPAQGIHQTWTCGLLLGTDQHSTLALRHHVHVNIDQCLQSTGKPPALVHICHEVDHSFS